jgi:phosphoenolpyruvate carboxykinase (GTP)
MAMLPFCGYNMADYFAHWMRVGAKSDKAPRIFHVNWFRQDADGKFIWPGFGENMRVLQWIARRCEGKVQGVETPLGVMPRFEDLNWQGLERVSPNQYGELTQIDTSAWREELHSHDELFAKLGKHLPAALDEKRSRLHQQIG